MSAEIPYSSDQDYGSLQPKIYYHDVDEEKQEIVLWSKDDASKDRPSAQWKPGPFISRVPTPSRPPRPSRQNPYDPFFVPATVLAASASSQPSSTFASLPTEVLTMIFRHVKTPHHQVCLALTCKTMAHVASYPDIMAGWRGWRDKTLLFYLFQKPDRQLTTANYYIPPHLHLCRACFRFVPNDPEYWKEKVASRKGYTSRAIDDWSRHVTGRCPDCDAEGYKSYSMQDEYHRDGCNEDRCTGDMCLELMSRMSRP
ncbi:hypothetical protein EDD37DRAFT_126136 [Exophiala viscosa]|uniref:F-box domain-containing protein n=1 Tax=Exophiala viscosa TaxID=2486360 RepID=A0AAN6DZ98_9EURO|nr:hypothetical protein EDD36DRAFT_221441 [Exophiala viscosa]KAI1621632.1 hypothetical protein EDD37DRAFT_126136 [Exophiala viscosa]